MTSPAPTRSVPARTYRPEIQGLRALAVLLVATYHLWFGRVSGGVDVFLLVTAFLMTGSFARKIEAGTFTGVRGVLTYWIHVFKRILPLASLTVVATLAGIFFFLPQERWLSLIDEAKSVLLYQQNWWSTKNLVDYYAADTSSASPLRHFWSLSVQGQIYLLWPLIFLGAWALIKLFKLPTRATLFTIFGAIFVGSLYYSIVYTAQNQQTAYFNTYARLWEFAAGTLLALGLASISLTPILRALLGWLGIIMLVSCGFIFDVEGLFPGYHALWPILAASFIIIAGDSGTRYGPEKLLTCKPLLKLGGFSYALYLVHWPLLVFYLAQVGQEKASPLAGLLLLAVSILLAWVLTAYLETPLRTWKWSNQTPLRALGVVGACLALGLSPAYGWKADLNKTVEEAMQNRALNNEGAKALEQDYLYLGEPNPTLLPLRTSGQDWAELGAQCSEHSPAWLTEELNQICNYPVKQDAPARTVLAVGNSHMQMWLPALSELARQENWDLVLATKGGCFFAPEDTKQDDQEEACLEASQKMQDLIDRINPDTVILTGSLSAADQPDTVTPGIEAKISQLTQQGRTVIGIRDTPRFAKTHKSCLDAWKATLEGCVMSPGQDVSNDPQSQLEARYPGFAGLNLSDLACPENICPVAIGNVYVYQDHDHLNATYVETTTELVAPRLQQALARAEARG